MEWSTISKKRAVSDEQKKERREKILGEALKLYEKFSYKSVSISDIAKNSGVAKGTVFLYFKTKEELFAYLTMQQIDKWFNVLDFELERLKKGRKKNSKDQIIKIHKKLIESHPVLLRLFAILNTTIEQNISENVALEFKERVAGRLFQAGNHLEGCLSFLKTGGGSKLILKIYALIIGFQHLSDPAPVFSRVIKKKQMEIFTIDFSDWFLETLEDLLIGLESKST